MFATKIHIETMTTFPVSSALHALLYPSMTALGTMFCSQRKNQHIQHIVSEISVYQVQDINFLFIELFYKSDIVLTVMLRYRMPAHLLIVSLRSHGAHGVH